MRPTCTYCDMRTDWVNHSCLESNEWEIYLHDDCISCYWMEKIKKFLSEEYNILLTD